MKLLDNNTTVENWSTDLDPLITIIIPVYNTYVYLKRCVESVCKQTYHNLEIILIDDGSTDGSQQLCDLLQEKDDRIAVLHNKNRGVSAARNLGLDSSHGEYVIFVDSDDWIEKETVANALITQQTTGADMIVWGYYADFLDDQHTVFRSNKYIADGMCQVDNFKILLQENALGLMGYVWNKLYKRDLLIKSNARFREKISLYEDILFNSIVCKECNSIVFTNFLGSHYIQQPGPTLGSKERFDSIDLKLMACKSRERILEHFGCEDTDIKRVMSSFYIAIINSYIRKVFYSDITEREQYEQVKKFLNSTEAIDILSGVRPYSVKNSISFYLARWKMVRVLQWIAKLRYP